MSFIVQKKSDSEMINIKDLYSLNDMEYENSMSRFSSADTYLEENTESNQWKSISDLSSTNNLHNRIRKYFDTKFLQEYINIDIDVEDDYNSHFFPKISKRYKIHSTTSSAIDDTKREEENRIQNEFENKLLFYIMTEEIGLGTYTEADKLIEYYLNNYNTLTQTMITDIYTKNIKNTDILCKLLLLVSRLDPTKINKTGYVFAMNALNHRSNDVKEYALRVFENFADEESLSFLEESKQDTYWLQEYKEEIIQDLKEKFGSY